jgi:hypothetical protein
MTFAPGGLDEKKAMKGQLHENGQKSFGQKADASSVMKQSGKNIGRKR